MRESLECRSRTLQCEDPWFTSSNDAILILSHLEFRPALPDKIIFSRDIMTGF